MASRRDASRFRRLGIHRTELCIDPADEIAVGDIAHEQEQAVGHLVKVAVAQRLARQWAGGDVARLSARCRILYGIDSRRTANNRRAWGRRGCGPGWL